MSKRRKNPLYTIWTAAVILCMLAAMFALAFASCSSGEDKASAAASPSASPAETPAPNLTLSEARTLYANVILQESDDVGQEYIDSMVFVGDSALKVFGESGAIPNAQIWTTATKVMPVSALDKTQILYPATGAMMTIAAAAGEAKPAAMLITAGYDGLSDTDETAFRAAYTALVKAIQQASPSTVIILNSVFPVAQDVPNSAGVTKELVDSANCWVLETAAETGVRFLDSAYVLQNESGYLADGYHTGDGVTLSAQACGILLGYLRTHSK